MGIMNPFRMVELKSPPNITLAIGLCISLPGNSPPNANGINASPEDKAVIRIGFRRSREPYRILSFTDIPEARRLLYLSMSSIPLRVAIPNREIKPMIAGILNIPDVK